MAIEGGACFRARAAHAGPDRGLEGEETKKLTAAPFVTAPAGGGGGFAMIFGPDGGARWLRRWSRARRQEEGILMAGIDLGVID